MITKTIRENIGLAQPSLKPCRPFPIFLGRTLLSVDQRANFVFGSLVGWG